MKKIALIATLMTIAGFAQANGVPAQDEALEQERVYFRVGVNFISSVECIKENLMSDNPSFEVARIENSKEYMVKAGDCLPIIAIVIRNQDKP